MACKSIQNTLWPTDPFLNQVSFHSSKKVLGMTGVKTDYGPQHLMV